MKKTVAILLCLVALLSLFACTPDEPEDDIDDYAPPSGLDTSKEEDDKKDDTAKDDGAHMGALPSDDEEGWGPLIPRG